MEIYYINSEEFLKSHDMDFLKKYSQGRGFKSEKRFIQFSLGRYLVKSVAQSVYGLSDTEIIIENEKPKFKNSSLHFSISHCGNYVAAAFDNAECGLDIEEMKQRDFAAFGERYGREFRSAKDFYEFWTEYEASIKLQSEPRAKYSCIFQEKFMLTAVSECEFRENPGIVEFK